MSSKPAIPAITIDNIEAPYDDQPPLPTESQQQPASLTLNPSHQRSPSDPNHLAPGGSNMVPRISQDDPPSPTGSHSNVHFATSVDLRHNQPDANSGAGSLALLTPGEGIQKHGRKNSAISLISAEGTEPDHGGQQMSPSILSTHTSITAVPPTPDYKSRFHHEQEGDHGTKHVTDDERPTEITDVDNCAPFGFRPKQLAEIAENKDVEALAKIGGTNAVLKGLGTSASRGLSSHALGEVSDEKSGGEGPFAATRDDRTRVFGVNTMPPQKTKSLLQLMWLALKDKVLVSIHLLRCRRFR
jgi:P-type Ca2+ transporter type 2C